MRTPLIAAALLCLPSLAFAGPIQLSAEDGRSLRGVSYGSGPKGVILVHDDGRSAEDWKTFGTKLGANGFHVVALDLRGHGATGGSLAEGDYPSMVHDVKAAANWLQRRGAQEIFAVGAGLGGNLAINAAADDPRISGVAMLTPSLNAKGVKVSAALEALGDRPLLLVADTSDAMASKAASLLAGKVAGPKQVEMYANAGAGVRMLNGAPALEGVLLGWLNGSWRTEEAGKERDLKAGSIQDVETTGTKLEERINR